MIADIRNIEQVAVRNRVAQSGHPLLNIRRMSVIVDTVGSATHILQSSQSGAHRWNLTVGEWIAQRVHRKSVRIEGDPRRLLRVALIRRRVRETGNEEDAVAGAGYQLVREAIGDADARRNVAEGSLIRPTIRTGVVNILAQY